MNAALQTLLSRQSVGAKHLVPFHHDPSHTDVQIDRMTAEAMDAVKPEYRVTPGREGATFEI